MSPLILDMPVARSPKVPMTSVKLPEDLIESARVIVAIDGGTIMELFDGILRPALEKLEREALTRRSDSLPPRPAGPKKGGGK